MWTNIINIGNSKGIILPASVLRELKIKEKSAVDISVKDGKIIIETSPRQGWE
ncbi:MAG: AbrB/MazE/SpoVT family DNA-binding domain-containing protein, partial [Bacteroidales bacterium]